MAIDVQELQLLPPHVSAWRPSNGARRPIALRPGESSSCETELAKQTDRYRALFDGMARRCVVTGADSIIIEVEAALREPDAPHD